MKVAIRKRLVLDLLTLIGYNQEMGLLPRKIVCRQNVGCGTRGEGIIRLELGDSNVRVKADIVIQTRRYMGCWVTLYK